MICEIRVTIKCAYMLSPFEPASTMVVATQWSLRSNKLQEVSLLLHILKLLAEQKQATKYSNIGLLYYKIWSSMKSPYR